MSSFLKQLPTNASDTQMRRFDNLSSHLAAPGSTVVSIIFTGYFLLRIACRKRLHHSNFISLAFLSAAHLLIVTAAIIVSFIEAFAGKKCF